MTLPLLSSFISPSVGIIWPKLIVLYRGQQHTKRERFLETILSQKRIILLSQITIKESPDVSSILFLSENIFLADLQNV